MSDLTTSNTSSHIAEVIGASITSFNAQAYSTIRPPFGSFVKAMCQGDHQGLEIFGVVFDVVMSPRDHIHKPRALGLTREQLRSEQPHIFALLETQIKAQIIGYRDVHGRIHQHLPPGPPDIHDFVDVCNKSEVKQLCASFAYLRLLEGAQGVPVDELIAASLREAARTASTDKQTERSFLLSAGRKISQLYRSDYERMTAIIRKISPQ